MASLLETHWRAVKRILQYLNGAASHDLLLLHLSHYLPFVMQIRQGPR